MLILYLLDSTAPSAQYRVHMIYEQLVTVITVYGMGKNLNSQLPEMF